PKDIPDAIAQGSAAASKVLGLLSANEISQEPIVAEVDEEICSGCGLCVAVCPYEARELDELKGISRVAEVLCQGCGACAVTCPNGATQLRNSAKDQIMSMIDALV
ncbi:hypothetical protein LCGC14_1683650, partial [marine sediment metagenome]